MANYSVIHSDSLNNQLRSLFLNYQILKYLKITESTKTLLAYDIKTKKNVIIKITSTDKVKSGDFHNILSILNHKTLPKVYFNQKIQNYQILVQKASEGVSLVDIKINKKDALKIFSQLVRLISYLCTYKIRTSGIQLRHIFVDKSKNITVSEVDSMEFDCKMDHRYEEEQMEFLLKILDYLSHKSDVDNNNNTQLDNLDNGKNTHFNKSDNNNNTHFNKSDDVISVDMRSEKTIKTLKKLRSLNEMLNVLGISQDQSSFKDVHIADPLVLHHINRLDVKPFDTLQINDMAEPEYFIYRLVDENIVREPFKVEFKEIRSILNKAKKMLTENNNRINNNKITNNGLNTGSLCVNEMEDLIFKALFRKEQLKQEIIKRRVDILHEEYPWSIRRYLGCLDESVVLSVIVFDIGKEKLVNKINIKEKYDGLEISETKKENKIVFSKKNGRTVDFKYLISEFIEESIQI